jgi:hypothetical protein
MREDLVPLIGKDDLIGRASHLAAVLTAVEIFKPR